MLQNLFIAINLNKMKKYFLFVFILTIGQLQAQNAMPTDSAMWVYGVRLYEDTPAHVRNLTVKLKGDTLLGGMLYSKVYYAWGHDTAYDSPNNYLHCFLRNDNNHRAYVRYPVTIYSNDTSDVLLYDFNQVAGDTFDLPRHRVGIDTSWCDTSYKYVVSSTFNIWENFLSRNIQYIQYETANPTCTAQFSQMREYYGSSDFIFYNELKVFPDCYFDDADSIYFSQGKCFWYRGKWRNQPCELYGADIFEFTDNSNEIKLSPNPFYDDAELNFTASKFEIFQLFDMLGKPVFESMIQENQNNIILQKGKLKSGIYFGRLTGRGNISGVIKIIIN